MTGRDYQRVLELLGQPYRRCRPRSAAPAMTPERCRPHRHPVSPLAFNTRQTEVYLSG